ncbi:HET-domain-containing protein, partial [Acephala macrosclerotiorum]
QVRLLRLQPRLKDSLDIITCTLEVADLTDQDCRYEALSYEWGDATNTSFSITLQGKDFSVRENLWWALWYLRLENDVRTLWIDALCINQSPVPERNYQVSQMVMVYQQAECVIAWIG